MKSMEGIGLHQVQAVYSGAEGQLWELIMGEQIHLGGLVSSMDLAEKAGITPGMSGIDLCCCSGAGMRMLVRLRGVARMHGVDATETVVKLGVQRCQAAGLSDRIAFTLADVCQTGLPAASADFVWGEDAWCYVVDKKRLMAEAARIVKPGGTIAFTDWVEGSPGLSDAEARRLLTFMKFPNIQDAAGYQRLLVDSGCAVLRVEDTGRFAPCVDLYLNMLNQQLTYDALRIVGYDMTLLGQLGDEMKFVGELAHAGKIAQGLFVARKHGAARQEKNA
ncbi:MAG: methyltransferase domain-containing protein [Planctomycetota bacterium]